MAASTLRWLAGMAVASVFSLIYLVAPSYILMSLLALLFQYPSRNAALLYALPMLISAAVPSFGAPFLAPLLAPMLDYFDYHEEFEISNEQIREMTEKGGKRFIIAVQPHGVISFVGLCWWIKAPPDFRRIKTAAASSLLKTPILKHVMGIFGLTDASAANLKRHLKKEGVEGSLVLYIGGIAELFMSCPEEERLYIGQRKGFIKMALREGADVIPAYFFGNTSVLSVLKHGPLAALSRRLGASLTLFWGKYYLPIPRDHMLLCARGKPLGLPHIPEPTKEDVDKYHALYVAEVKRLYNKNRERLPQYKHKKIIIE